jgi:MoaA/NifB/PqqE/SkfB family radical SAM enzyme
MLTRERMRDLKDAGLDNLLISLDSMNPRVHDEHRAIKGCHAKVVRCAHWLAEDFLTGHRTGGVMYVLTSRNLHEIAKLVEFADELGIYVVLQPYHDNKTGNAQFNADISTELVDDILRLQREHKTILASVSYLRGLRSFYQRDHQPRCYAGHKYFSIDPYGFLHPCVDMPGAGHLLRDDISVVRSMDAMRNVETCPGCWYAFRGESDTALSFHGCLEKLRLGLTVMMGNRGHPKAEAWRG